MQVNREIRDRKMLIQSESWLFKCRNHNLMSFNSWDEISHFESRAHIFQVQWLNKALKIVHQITKFHYFELPDYLFAFHLLIEPKTVHRQTLQTFVQRQFKLCSVVLEVSPNLIEGCECIENRVKESVWLIRWKLWWSADNSLSKTKWLSSFK